MPLSPLAPKTALERGELRMHFSAHGPLSYDVGGEKSGGLALARVKGGKLNILVETSDGRRVRLVGENTDSIAGERRAW